MARPEESWYLGAVFNPGTKVGRRGDDPSAFVRVAEVVEVATVRVPSGRLIVDSPWPEERGADLVTFSAEGTTPVWLGCTETGSIASVAVAVGGDHDPAAGNPLS